MDTQLPASGPILAIGVLPEMKQDDQGHYVLSLKIPDHPLNIELSSAQVRTLGLQCLRYFPDIEPRFVVPSEEEAYRLPARKIIYLDDRSIQLLLREVQSESLILFLWYMKDPGLAKKIFRNMAYRAAQMLLDDLEVAYDTLGDPNQASLAVIEPGRTETLEIMRILDRLQDEGQIPRI